MLLEEYNQLCDNNDEFSFSHGYENNQTRYCHFFEVMGSWRKHNLSNTIFDKDES